MDPNKRIPNTFTAGLVTDRHPLTSQNTELIEARNIDLIQVGEGYQLVLQKREGNVEVSVIPSTWDSITTYLTDEYVINNDLVYKSLQNDNLNKDTSNQAYWELQNVTLVSAGLREGYIPLAVKEFNNVAYIISVNPDTNKGELGTFPSPDYSLFKYQIGDEVAGAITIGSPIIDSEIDPPDFRFTIVTNVDLGEDESIDSYSYSARDIEYSELILTNTGTQASSYSITSSDFDGKGLSMLFGGIPITVNTDIINLNPHAVADLIVQHTAPYTLVGASTYYAPNVQNSVTVVVTCLDEPSLMPDGSDTNAYTFVYHLPTKVEVTSNSGTWVKFDTEVDTTVTADPANVDYETRSNDATLYSLVTIYSQTPDSGWAAEDPPLRIGCDPNGDYVVRHCSTRITSTYTIPGGEPYSASPIVFNGVITQSS